MLLADDFLHPLLEEGNASTLDTLPHVSIRKALIPESRVRRAPADAAVAVMELE